MKHSNFLHKLISTLWEFPCPLCDCDNQTNHEFNSFCPDCLEQLPLLHGKRCIGCGGNIDSAVELCTQCLSMPPRLWDAAMSIMEMKDLGEKAVYALKFSGNTAMARALAELGAPLLVQPEFRNCDMIVPVPLHWRRYLQRGYNQSELLAKMLAKHLQIPCRKPLKRLKATTRQATLSREKRLTNLKDAFVVPHAKTVKNKRILLVDDVLTTGSTLHACAEALVAAGASGIAVFTVARR